ncbi:MAG: hypothetical protein GX640_22840 [Fibrobacter sp.]|nr:hypothetical protein [Fibrobacter sp.]
MGELELRMIKLASQKHQKIFPCSHKEHFSDCFTRYENQICFWYNTEDQSTHVITAIISDSEITNSSELNL